MSTLGGPSASADANDGPKPVEQAATVLMGADGRARPPLPPARALPKILGYEIMHVLGHGGMSTVYLASQTALKRRVAIKVMREEDWNDAGQRERFRREAEAIATLQHPHVVQIFEVGEANGAPYLVLEYVSGGTLDRHIGGRPLPVREAARIVQQLAEAIQAAHDRQIVHRALKPANILLSAEGGLWSAQSRSPPPTVAGADDSSLRIPHSECRIAKVTDFGLARLLTDEARQTQSGLTIGTPSYMAPEQTTGKSSQVGKPADIYGLGTILYEALAGRPPFEGDTPLETLLLVQREEAVPPGRINRKVPRDLETICLKCLEKEPRRRYATAQELALDLERFLNGQPVQARPISMVARLLKWGKRRPSGALALAAGFLLVCGLVAYLITVQWLNSQLKTTNQELKKKTDELEALTLKEKNRNRALHDLLSGAEIDPAEWLALARNDPDDIWAQLRAFDAMLGTNKIEAAKPFLDRARQLAWEATHQPKASPDAWSDLAHVHDRASDLCKSQHDLKGCWVEQEQSLQLRLQLFENDFAAPRRRLELCASLLKMAKLHLERGATDDDRQAGQFLIQRLELLLTLPDSEVVQEALAQTHEVLAEFCRRTGDMAKADEHGADAKKLHARAKRSVPKSP